MRISGLQFALAALVALVPFTGTAADGVSAYKPELLDITVLVDVEPCEPVERALQFENTLDRLAAHAEARRAAVARFEAEAAAESEKLKAEHRALMVKMGSVEGADGQDVDGRWAVDLYTNVARQADVKRSLQDRIAAWDSENPLRVVRTDMAALSHSVR